MTSVACRILGPGDEDVLARVADGVFDHPAEPARVRALLGDPAHVLAVAIREGEAVGAILSVVSLRVDKPPELWINEAGVADRWQRQGIGRALMHTTLGEARARGCAGTWVASDKGQGALAFYRALGGVEEGGQTHFAWTFAGH